MADERHFIDVLSDSTGATAERVVRAALLQFPQSQVHIRLHTRVRTKQRAEPILQRAARDGALLIFSVVSPDLSAYLHQATAEHHIAAIDVIGAVISKLETFFAESPINRPGALLPLSEEYFRRIEAVEFTVKTDSGRDPSKYQEADLILAGVSRTSKTPVATLLAQRGLKVANVTIALNNRTPSELTSARPGVVVGLTIDVDSLCAMRQDRLRELGMPADAEYAVRAHVQRELAFATDLFETHNWPIVDMTGRSVDETAGIILEVMNTHRLSLRPPPA